ncbi:LysR family transcriptional regulator [Maricaulis sp. D1M11]|uniref:LysR family transcriptional regulator n=1 Tax=Maricaulis sp. D1M11 TaxID=3076117 RepID=UPI0039B6202E
MDWDDLRIFQTFASTGSMSETARQLGVDATTVSRRIRRLEARLGGRLTERRAQGLALSQLGAETLQHIGDMQAAAHRVSTLIARDRGELDGEVKIASGGEFLRQFLAPLVWDMAAEFPRLGFHLISGEGPARIDRFEADFAFRITPDPPQDVVARKLGDLPFGLYVHRRLQEAAYRGQTPLILGLVEDWPDWARAWSRGTTPVHRLNREGLQLDAVRAGAGVACLPRALAAREADLVPLSMGADLPSAPLWLIYHTDARRIERLRRVRERLETGMERLKPTLFAEH